MVHLWRQQHKPAGKYGEDLQKIPGFFQHGLPLPGLHLLKEIGAPDVVQCLKQDEQEVGKAPGVAIVAHGGGVHQSVQHQGVHLIEDQVGQVVKHRRQGQHQTEFPVFPVIIRPAPQQNSHTDRRAHHTVGKGIGNHPAHIPGLIGHSQNQDHRQNKGHQHHHHGQDHVPARPELIDIFLIQKLHAEIAEGL